MSNIERECKRTWLNAMRQHIAGPWYGFRSQREALVRTITLLDFEVNGTSGFYSAGGNFNY